MIFSVVIYVYTLLVILLMISVAGKGLYDSLILLFWSQVNGVSFSPFNEWILATASSDKTINLFDLRKLPMALHTFSSHTYALAFELCHQRHQYVSDLLHFQND